MDKVVLDTSVLMSCCNIIDKLKHKYNIIIPLVVVEELDNLKSNKMFEKEINARSAIKNIEKNTSILYFDFTKRIVSELDRDYTNSYNYNTNDDIIISIAYLNGAAICTNDLNMKIKAKSLRINVVDIPKDCLYRGYKKVKLTDEELSYLYSNPTNNIYDLCINQYILIYNEADEFIDNLKWTSEGYKKIDYQNIKTRAFGTLKPKDEYQRCAIDSLFNNEATILYGKAGTGKTQLSLSYLMKLLETGEISKIYMVYSYDTLRGAKTLGYEKGTHTEKVLSTASIGNILSTKFGDISAVESLIIANSLEIIPTANIRGAEFKSDSALYVTEAQNLDVYTLKTIIQRCKGNCKQIYEGDIIEQTDVNISHSGMERMLEVFQGYEDFGCMKLKYNYRGGMSALADKM